MSRLKVLRLPYGNLPESKDYTSLVPPVVIGRGALLKCPQKKVSRSHALIDWSDEGILITSLHDNPTYIKVDGNPKKLTKEEATILKNGDHFGLLEDEYWFEICIEDSLKNGEEISLLESNSTNCVKVENVEISEEKRVVVSFSDDETKSDALKECAGKSSTDEERVESIISEGIQMNHTSNELLVDKCQRKRDLPKWLSQPKESIIEKKGEKERISIPHGKPVKSKPSKGSKLPKSHLENVTKEIGDKKTIGGSPSKAKKYHSISQEYDNTPTAASAAETNAKESPKREEKRPVDDRTTKRDSCQYGASCYRKNPEHKKEYAHPGDEDYAPPTNTDVSDEDDPRPQCEFGIDCYRKNPQHRKNYKHTRIPQPKRSAARKRPRKASYDGDSENDYDYDDPFLNDGSSDDYDPTDSGSDSPMEEDGEEEDTTRMLKEAKKFVKKKNQ